MDTGENLVTADTGLGNGRTNGAGKLHARNRRPDLERSDDGSGEGNLSEADQLGRVEVADSPPRAQKWKSSDSVFLRLARAQEDVKKIDLDVEIKVKAKDGSDTRASYKGVSHAQIVTNAKAALLANGIVFYPVMKRDGVQVTGNKTAVYIDGHFVSVDDGDDRIVTGAWGAGTDFNDKDYSKAFTNAVKNCLAKMLGMSTLEDDSSEATPHEPEHKPRALKNAEALTDVAIKSWADAYKAALDGCKTAKQLKTIRAENAAMMNNPGVPQVTKDYFLDKIAALEGTLV